MHNEYEVYKYDVNSSTFTAYMYSSTKQSQ